MDYSNRLLANEWSVETIEHSAARHFVEQFHYAKGMSNTAIFCHGLFDELGCLLGVATWLCPTQRACKTVDPEDWRRVVSLSRMVLHPSVPKNGCTFLLSRSVRLIAKDGRYRSLVTFADSAQGHSGGIYRAAGWTYVGRTVPTPLWIEPATGRMRSIKADRTRTVAELKALGLEFRGRFFKHKFVKYLDRRLHRLHCEL
jgi:hypothetical protein